MTPIGVQSIAVSLTDPSHALASALRGSAPRVGLVIETAGGLALQVAGARVPLPETAGLSRGQAVEVSLVMQDGKATLHVTPRTGGHGPSGGGPPATSLISTVLDALGVRPSSRTPSVEMLVPANLPISTTAVRALFALFASQSGGGAALARIAAQLQEAVETGAIARARAAPVLELARLMTASNPKDIESALRSLARAMDKPVEARLLRMTNAAGAQQALAAAEDDPVALLRALRDDPALRQHFERAGRLSEFVRDVDSLIDQLTNARVQNVRALEQPYFFLELPLHPEAEIRRAHIHVFGEGGGKDRLDPDAAMVVFDLATTHLGDLWITLRTRAGSCECRFRALGEQAKAAIEGASKDLSADLERLGYGNVSIDVSTWDGDRLTEIARVFERFSGLDVEA